MPPCTRYKIGRVSTLKMDIVLSFETLVIIHRTTCKTMGNHREGYQSLNVNFKTLSSKYGTITRAGLNIY
jgi:hypothetical protein